MRCEKVMHKFNDLLDGALSAGEENEIRAHLALCPNCRSEFELVKNADDMLRTTVIEMLAEIEVPSDLSQKIEELLAAEKKRQAGKARLFGLLQAPVFAAAMLVLVCAAGIFGYYKFFEPFSKSPAVVLSAPQSQADSEIVTEADSVPVPVTGQDQTSANGDSTNGDSTNEAPYRTASPLASKTQAADGTISPTSDAGSRSAEAIDRQSASPGQSGENSLNSKEKVASDLDLSKDAFTEEQSRPMVSRQSSGDAKLSMTSMAAPRQGTLAEATRGAGFKPAVPGYLPSGAELKDVTWSPGTVCLEYRAGENFFTLTQSRVAGVGAVGEGNVQFIDINGAKAQLQETDPTGDQKRGYTTVWWQYGEWMFTVGSDLPREEILRIALSIK